MCYKNMLIRNDYTKRRRPLSYTYALCINFTFNLNLHKTFN